MSPSREIEIVVLEACHVPIPQFDLPFPQKYTEYDSTSYDQEEVARRIGTAEIVQTTRVPIRKEAIEKCPNLKMIALMASGTDMIDLETCKSHGITVSNIPSAATETVAEHAIGLYFAVRRNTVKSHQMTVEGKEWMENKRSIQIFNTKATKTCKNEVMGIIGGGRLGKVLAGLATALGMKVLIAERKGVPDSSTRSGRTSFPNVLKGSTVIVLTCPLSSETLNTISITELQSMQPEAIVINVARGGVVDEIALIRALREGWIAGAATDVFVVEPATKENNVLLKEYDSIPNLTLSAHTAWYSETTVENLQKTVKENVESWVAGKPLNVVV